jgi:hypothetical protein
VRILHVITIALVTATSALAQVTQLPANVDYDTFMQQDVQRRIRTFNQITPENRAELVRTQITRWVDQNRARLTPEQLKMMEENLAFVTAARYQQPPNDEDKTRANDLQARTVALFSRDDIRQAMTINATYIPKK